MFITRRPASSLEPFEARIAPALTVVNPLADLFAGIGDTGAKVDLGAIFDPAAQLHTTVRFITNFDSDPNVPGVQGDIVIELFDQEAPLSVQNFLRYVNGTARGDYDETFFHRAVPGFVLQGGGFETRNLAVHIPVGAEVHNEFSASRSNLRGTVAMAKTSVGPHTATSEFFINVADNSGNLDNQNGGFTVFGEVTQGMNVVDAIMMQPLAGGAAPVQDSYNPDPDNNPATSSPAPLPSDLITILDAVVTRPSGGTSPGVTFSVVSVTDATTGLPTSLVKARLSGESLGLNYADGKKGVAKVTIQATDGLETTTDAFLVTVKPNLVSNVVKDPLAGIIVPGDVGLAKVKVINNAATTLRGKVDVTFYLSHLDGSAPGGTDPEGSLVEPARDVVLGMLSGVKLKLASGASRVFASNIDLPPGLIPVQGEPFRLIAEVTPRAGTSLGEVFTDDNNAIDGNVHELFNAFGTFEGRVNVPIKIVGPDGALVTVTLNGGGLGRLFPLEDGGLELGTTGTTALSVLSVKTTRGAAPLGLDGIFITQPEPQVGGSFPLGVAALGSVTLRGDFIAPAGVRSLTLGGLDGGATGAMIQLGAFGGNPAQRATIQLGHVTNFSLSSAMPIASLAVADWSDTAAAPGTITTPALTKFGAVGVMEADITVSGTSKVAKFTAGTLSAATVRIAGDVGVVSLGAMLSSKFLVGTDDVPATLDDFTAARRIDSFAITGKGTDLIEVMEDSTIAAARFGIVRVGRVDTTGSGDFGFVADAIGEYMRGTVRHANLDAPGEIDRVQDYVVRLL